jgi:hypothetical protein
MVTATGRVTANFAIFMRCFPFYLSTQTATNPSPALGAR